MCQQVSVGVVNMSVLCELEYSVHVLIYCVVCIALRFIELMSLSKLPVVIMILSVSECISVSRSLYHNVALWQSSLDDNLSHTLTRAFE